MLARHQRPDRSVDQFNDLDATKSFTLAADLYTDPAVLDAEKTAVFARSWIFGTHVSNVAEPGAYVALEIVGQRVFIIRSADGELHAFFNVCQHRGHSLLEGSGVVTSLITCPYHAWAYQTNGRLKGARMSDRMDDFDLDDFTLPSVAVEEFCGFVFVNLDPDALPMDQVYPGLRAAVSELCDDPASLVHVNSSAFDIAANWKNVGDNLLECYHCHPAHKAFVDLIDMDGYLNELHQNWSIQSGPANTSNDTYNVDSGAEAFASIFIWPNVSIGRLPGQGGVLIFNFTPTGPETTHQMLSVYAPSSDVPASEVAAFAYFNDVLGPEDVKLVEDVQVGLRSLGYHQGRFICIPDRPEISEHAVHHFHTMVRQALAR